MPIFEYKCEQCGHVTEVLEKPNARGKHTCCECGSHEMVKLFSGFGTGSSRGASGGSRPAGGGGFT